jgi:hypothetical protein
MPIHVNVCCDECKVAQGFHFEAESETFGELLEALRASKWEVTFSGGVTRTVCQDCCGPKSFDCPICGTELKEVRYPGGSYLNRDQWESSRAGDYYCTKCVSDVARSGYLYWWRKELVGAK